MTNKASRVGILRAMLIAALLPGCRGCNKLETRPPDPTHLTTGHKGVVVSVSGPASDVGLSVLQSGGNAVDATVAAAFALAVTHPQVGGLGGGGILLVHPGTADGKPQSFDYRERAPMAAIPTQFGGDDQPTSPKAVAVPGTVRGLASVHGTSGRLPWTKLLAPAVALAREGFAIDGALAGALNGVLAEKGDFAELRRVFTKPGGGAWKAGDRLKQPDLARTMETIALQGADAFYKGPIANAIVAEMAHGGGLVTLADLEAYRSVGRVPLSTRYRDRFDVFVPSPPDAGGIALLQELHMLENYDLKKWGRWAPETSHVMAEAMRRANDERVLHVGDTSFAAVPPQMSKRPYGLALAKDIDLEKATTGGGSLSDKLMSTENAVSTQISVVDDKGMAVASAFTLQRNWGSRIVVKGMGFVLNSDMFAFHAMPKGPDAKGVFTMPPNSVAPGKRPLLAHALAIVSDKGQARLITGSPGTLPGSDTVLQLLVSVLDFDMPLATATAAPRFSLDSVAGELRFEGPEQFGGLCKDLGKLGHKVVRTPARSQGDAHSIWVSTPGDYTGVADDRVSGKASGF